MAKKYLAIGPHGWAKADRADFALHECLSFIAYWEGFDAVPIHIYSCHKSTYVNEMGDFCWARGKPKPEKYMEYAIPPKYIRRFKEAQEGLEYNVDGDYEEFYKYTAAE